MNWRRKTTRAEVVWEDAVDHLIELVADDPGARVIEHFDTVSFMFDQKVLLRLKKADISLKTSNVQTYLSDLFDDPEIDLFGYEGLQRVEACYVLDEFETQIIWTGIVARENGHKVWHFEIQPEAANDDDMQTVVDFPEAERRDTASLARLRDDRFDEDRKEGSSDGSDGD